MLLPGVQTLGSGPETDIGSGHFLAGHDVSGFTLVGDPDGTGRAGLIEVNTRDHTINYSKMAASGKLTSGVRARDGFGGTVIAATCGDYLSTGRAETLALMADGQVVVAYGMDSATKKYASAATAATLDKSAVPKPPVRAFTADFDGDGKPDVLLVGSDGRLVFLRNARADAAGTQPRFESHVISDTAIKARRIVVGNVGAGKKASVVWIERDGAVRRAAFAEDASGGWRLSTPTSVTTASADDGLAIGHFRGPKSVDLIVGQRLLPAGGVGEAITLPNLPAAAQAKDDAAWIAGDFNGDGKDDILRVHESASPFDGDHLYVHYAHDSSDKSELAFDDGDNDGLPDAWETGAIHPGGLDLNALGCSPNHADVIVEVQRIADVPEAQLRLDIDKMIRYFAALPVKNPDGVPGIAVHVIYNDPIPLTESNMGWRELGAKYHAANHRGITHWMVISNAGGGQSSEMGDEGGCGRFGMPAVFIHEFGHQLGLDHTGRWGPGSCPVYPSLMNYSYNYQLNGKAENVGFSDGRLSAVVLNERHLDEYLPLPMEKIAYLAGPPYHFRMKPAPNGKGTLIDWNWNGVFGEKDIAADINYGYSTTAGERHVIAKTYTAPALATMGDGKSERLLAFNGVLPAGTPPPAVDPKAKNASLSAEMPGGLSVRIWKGVDRDADGEKWSAESVVAPDGVTGEASATNFDGAAWVAYPTRSGIAIRKITLGKSDISQAGTAQIVPNSASAQPTLTSLDGHLLLLLWRDRKIPIGSRWLQEHDGQIVCGDETPLAFTSNVPIGTAAGSDSSGQPALWIGLTQDQDGKRVSRWQIRCLTFDRDAAVFYETGRFWVDGDTGRNAGDGRVTVLWEKDAAFGPDGRWYFLQRGAPGNDLSMDFIGMRIADKTVNGGCLTRRYYDEWTNSRSAPSACWFQGDIAMGVRWFGDSPAYRDNNLFVGFFGRGIESTPMGDFDDLTEIRDFGLAGSITRVNE